MPMMPLESDGPIQELHGTDCTGNISCGNVMHSPTGSSHQQCQLSNVDVSSERHNIRSDRSTKHDNDYADSGCGDPDM